MQEADVIGYLLFPADEQPPGTVEPGMSAFDFPPPRLAATMLRLRGFVGFARHMRRVAAPADLAVNRFAGIAFIETEMLQVTRSGCGTFDRDGVECGGDQFLVRHIGAFRGDGQRLAAAIDQRRALHSQLAAIGRIFPGFFPPPAAPSSSPRPCSAISSRCLSGRRTRSRRVPRAPRTRPIPPIPGNTHGSRCPSRTEWASPSTDSPWTTRTKCRPRRFAWEASGAHLCNWFCKSGSPDRSAPTRPRESGETLTLIHRPLTHLRAIRGRTTPKLHAMCQWRHEVFG